MSEYIKITMCSDIWIMWSVMESIQGKGIFVLKSFQMMIDEILKALLRQEKALELNMAGLKYGLPICTSAPGCVKKIPGAGRRDHHSWMQTRHKPEHIAYDFG